MHLNIHKIIAYKAARYQLHCLFLHFFSLLEQFEKIRSLIKYLMGYILSAYRISQQIVYLRINKNVVTFFPNNSFTISESKLQTQEY